MTWLSWETVRCMLRETRGTPAPQDREEDCCAADENVQHTKVFLVLGARQKLQHLLPFLRVRIASPHPVQQAVIHPDHLLSIQADTILPRLYFEI